MEYRRHLDSDFYCWVGKIQDAGEIKVKCREELKDIVNKWKGKGCLSIKDVRQFNLGQNKDYLLPSLNLMPKGHKLSVPANPGIEGNLTGRPVVTGHSWCTAEASRFLQRKFREILNKFLSFLKENNFQNTILGSSMELIDSVRKVKLTHREEYCFVTFDFKDLYTNILYTDVARTSILSQVLKLNGEEIELHLELYQFCND